MAQPPQVSVPGLRSPAVGLESPFEMLHACHERVHRTLALLARLQTHLARYGADPDARQAARDVLRYFDLAAPLHHQDEELHVFPVLLAQPDHAGLHARVHQLQQEHIAMESAWALARVVLCRVADADAHGSVGADAESWQPITAVEERALNAFSSLYGSHIQTEEQSIYPAARPLLSIADLQAMTLDMTARRQGAKG